MDWFKQWHGNKVTGLLPGDVFIKVYEAFWKGRNHITYTEKTQRTSERKVQPKEYTCDLCTFLRYTANLRVTNGDGCHGNTTLISPQQ